MANLTESPIYEPGIFQLEKTTPPLGGAPAFNGSNPSAGHANVQALQLANRTAFLYSKVMIQPSNVTSFAEIRSYVGNSSSLIVTGLGSGTFFYDSSDTTSPDNNSTIIVDAGGRRWKRMYDLVYASFFGALGGGVSKPLSNYYSTLSEAQIDYPHATNLSDELDWAAIQGALNSSFSTITLSATTYILNKELSASNKNIVILGQGVGETELRFTADVAYGVRVSQNSSFETTVKDIFISTNLLNTGTALSISYAGYVGEYERNKRLVNVLRCRAAGTDYFSYAWKNCFEFDEVTLPLIEDNFAVGYRNLSGTGEGRWWPWTEYGFIYKSSTNLSPTDALFNSNDCRYIQTAYQNLGVLEGVRYNDCIAVACKYGIVDDRREVSGPITIDPWLSVHNCHLNVSSIGIRTYYTYQGWIVDNLIYQFIFVDQDFIGVYTQTGNNWKINHNHITGNNGSTFNVLGIKVQQNNRSFVDFNEIENVDVAIECSGTDGITGTRFFMNRATDKTGTEVTPVVYTNGSSRYLNPVSNPVGIVFEGSNSSVVNIATGGFGDLLTFDLGPYPSGSIFRLTTTCQILKGGTTGTTKLYVEKVSGTASVSYMSSYNQLGVQSSSHTANTNWIPSLSGIIKKTTKGSLILKVAVASFTSNASVATGDGQVVLERIV